MKTVFISLLFLVSSLASAAEHKLTATFSSDAHRGDQGAYWVDHFQIDEVPFTLYLGKNQVQNLLWHLDGTVVAVGKNGMTIELGKGEPPKFDVTKTGWNSKTFSMTFPAETQVKASCSGWLRFPFFSGDDPTGFVWARFLTSKGKIVTAQAPAYAIDLHTRQFQIWMNGGWANR